jgi:type VI secretion system protein ImpH
MRDAADSVAIATHTASQRVHTTLQQWKEGTWNYDYFAVLRRLEASAYPQPRWGKAVLPSAESVRIGQEPSLAFAPASLSRIEDATAHSPPRLRQQFIGYLGPNGPLPVHLSDFIQERALNRNDPTWLAFLDGFTHRFALHFYRAWAQARPAVALDRPEEDNFRRYVGAFVGSGTPARQNRDVIHDDARLHFSGWLARQVRSKDSVEAVLAGYFGISVKLEQWVGHWIQLAADDVTRLGRGSTSRALGLGAVMGTQVWDRQHRVRVRLGPLTMQQYQLFLPGGSARTVLQRWMQQLLGDEYYWDALLVLREKEVPPTRLGAASKLGWTSWMGNRNRHQHAADVSIPG